MFPLPLTGNLQKSLNSSFISSLIKLTLEFKFLKLTFIEQVKGWPHSGFSYYNYSVLARLYLVEQTKEVGSSITFYLLELPPLALTKPYFPFTFF